MTVIIDSAMNIADRKHYAWTIWQAMVVGFVYLFTTVALFVLSYIWRYGPNPYTELGRQIFVTVSTALTLVVVAALAAGTSRPRSLPYFLDTLDWNLRTSAPWWLGAGLLAGVINHRIVTGIHASDPHFERGARLQVFVWLLLGTVVLQPVLEEMYFRGILFIALARRVGEMLSIAFVTSLFVFLHVQHRLAIAPLAVLLGLVRIKTKSLAICVAFHAGINLGIVLYTFMLST